MTRLEALTAARDLIADAARYTSQNFAEDANGDEVNRYSEKAVRWNSVGALCVAAGRDNREVAFAASDQLDAAVSQLDIFLTSITGYERAGHTHAEVLSIFDTTIAAGDEDLDAYRYGRRSEGIADRSR